MKKNDSRNIIILKIKKIFRVNLNIIACYIDRVILVP